MKTEHIIGVMIVVLVGAGLGVLLISPSQSKPAVADTGITEIATGTATIQENQKPKGEPYKDIVNPSGFVNTPSTSQGEATPITIKQFIGKKVILIDFLTYSCINCQRTFPYLNAWDEKYRDQGLEIIGIHTPEFAFEKNIDNVRKAMQKFGITHPIVLDNDYSTWNAWGNQYWPRKYLIDIYGNVVYDHIGEGAYEETEMKIRELLDERAKVLGEKTTMDTGSLVSNSVVQAGSSAKSPETYFGSDRNEYLGNGARGTAGLQNFSIPQTIKSNTLYLGGKWNITGEYAKNTEAEAKILYKFDSNNVYLVTGASTPVKITVMLDGKKYGDHTIQTNTLYTLISNAGAGEHTLEIVVSNSGLEAYAFTFN